MKRYYQFIIAVVVLSLINIPVHPAHAGHFTTGAEGYKVSTLPTDGVYWKIYNVYYSGNRLKDNSGKSVDGNFNVDMFAQLHRIGIVTGVNVLGWDWLIDVCFSLQHTNMSRSLAGENGERHGGGFGDTLVSPFLMSYHGSWYDLLISPAGIYVPTGYYNKDEPTSPGLNYWGILPTIGATFYLNENKSASLSFISRYEINFENSENNTTDGQTFHLEAAIGKTFQSGVDLALCFAGSWQTTDHKGKGAANDDRYAKQAFGPEIGYTFKDWGANVSLRWLQEFNNRNGMQGNLMTLSITKLF
jgi:hypothetical protein